MIRKKRSALASVSACLLAGLILISSPGLPCYQALAASFDADAAAARPVESVPASGLGPGIGLGGSLAPLEQPQTVLAGLENLRPAALFLDLDKTITVHKNYDPAAHFSPEAVEKVNALLAKGVPVVFNTGRSMLHNASVSPHFPATAEDLLIAKIPPALRRHLIFVGRLGSEIVRFDAQGKPVVMREDGWNSQERARIQAVIESSLKDLGVAPDELDSEAEHLPGISYLSFKTQDARADKLAVLIGQKARAEGLALRSHGDSGRWIILSKNTKGTGGRAAYEHLKKSGYGVREDNLLAIGDDFALHLDGLAGTDAEWALAFPKSRALSVGDADAAALPPNVQRLGQGVEWTNRALDALLAGRRAEYPLLAKLRAAWKNPAVQKAAFALLGAGAVLSWPILWAHQGAALISTGLLLIIGLPQIVEDFPAATLQKLNRALAFAHLPRIPANPAQGEQAAEAVSTGTNFIWTTLSFSLLSAGILTNTSWWIASNSFSVIKRLVIGGQINYYRRSPKLWLQSGLVLAGGLGLLALGFFPIYFSAKIWASAITTGAIGLLIFINLPQIKKDYRLYQAPEPQLPNRSKADSVMLVLAAIFGLIAASAVSNYDWAAINVISLATALVMTGQLFLPKQTNAILGKVFKRLLKNKAAPPAPSKP
ncbi:MAG TPA: hypothetical protein VNH15_00045 [Elusimicrobiota bacterium]|nr:hypothetical protein [Elusimicrobiota bacterium]